MQIVTYKTGLKEIHSLVCGNASFVGCIVPYTRSYLNSERQEIARYCLMEGGSIRAIICYDPEMLWPENEQNKVMPITPEEVTRYDPKTS